MTITPHFVFVHLPKTGGTFVSRHCWRIWGDQCIDYPTYPKHAKRREIPAEYRHLPVVGTIRSPYDWFVSAYHFPWWRDHAESFPGLQSLPTYPDVSFDQFVRLATARWWARQHPELGRKPQLGHAAYCWVAWLGKEPFGFLRAALDAPPTPDAFREQLAGARLLRTSRLNQDLAELLAGCGVMQSEIDAVLESTRVQPGDAAHHRRQRDWRPFYSPKLKAFVRESERVFFDAFPEFDE